MPATASTRALPPRPSSRLLAAIGAFAAALGIAVAARSAPETARPNLVFILADDLGRAEVGCYGGEIPTPNLDRLAARGLRFTQAYNNARCCPSRATALTGLHPHQTGIGHMVDDYASGLRAKLASPAYSDALSPAIPTLADVLSSAGYATWMSGKWHLGDTQPAHQRGFQRSFSLPRGAMNYFGRGTQISGRAEENVLLEDGRPWPIPAEGFYSTVAFTDWAIARIREHDRRRPFFLYLAHNAPHWPLHALPEDIARQRGRYDEGYEAIRDRRLARQRELGLLPASWQPAPRPDYAPAWKSLSKEQQRDLARRMEVYAAQVERLDREIGRLLATLEETGQAENTLVVFFSDNGAEPIDPAKGDPAAIGAAGSYFGYRGGWTWAGNAPFTRAKCFSHEGGISSPALAFWPAGIKRPGRDVATPVHLLDLAPTFVELAGARWPERWRELPAPAPEGLSLRPLLADAGDLPARRLFQEHEGTRYVRDGRWKLVSLHRGPWELYDLETDRTERNDLAAAHPERVAELSAAWQTWADRVGAQPWPAPPRKF